MDMPNQEQLTLAPKITTCFVDLDNTLWEGILAEGQKPKLYVDRYETLKKLYSKGIQIYEFKKIRQNSLIFYYLFLYPL